MDPATVSRLVSLISNNFREETLIAFFYFQRAQNICERYPDYRFTISGMGELPENTDEKHGKCSQMACFVRKDMLSYLTKNTSTDQIQMTPDAERDSDVIFPIEKFPYNKLFTKDFPYDQDCRSREEKILDDVKYYLHRHLSVDDPYFNENQDNFEFPIKDIYNFVHDVTDLNELRTIVRKEFEINERDCIAQNLPEYSDFESNDDEYDNNDEPAVATENNEKSHGNANDEDESWD